MDTKPENQKIGIVALFKELKNRYSYLYQIKYQEDDDEPIIVEKRLNLKIREKDLTCLICDEEESEYCSILDLDHEFDIIDHKDKTIYTTEKSEPYIGRNNKITWVEHKYKFIVSKKQS